MTSYTDFIATVLDSSAGAYAGYAATRLMETDPGLEKRFAPDAFGSWRSSLTQHVHDLAIAMELDAPPVFAAAVGWSRHAFMSRELPAEDLRHSLEALRDVLTEELPPAASPRLGQCFEAAFDTLQEPAREPEGLDPSRADERLALTYLQACLEGDASRAIRAILDALDQGLPVRQAYLHVVSRAQEEVGRLWHAGKVAVHEEHFVTATSARVLSLLSVRLAPGSSNGLTVVGATIQGNVHELGIRILMDLFGAAGWRSICLGSSMPARELALATQSFRADLLVLSVMLLSQLKSLRQTIETVRQGSPGVKVLVGGRAFDAAPQAWKWAGADAYAQDVDEALSTAQGLVKSK